LGLETLNTKPRKGLHELLQKQGLLLKKIGTHEIAWQITPLINSTGRMGVPDKSVRLFLSDEPAERNRLADEIMELNRERKAVGEAAWNSIYQRAQSSYQECAGKLVIVAGDDIQRGITGTIALKLLNYFNTTSVAVAFTDGTAIGSVRGTGDVNVKNILEKRSDLFIDFGGHDFAAGFSIDRDRFEEFKRFIMKEVEDHACEIELIESVSIDAELPGKYMNPDLMTIVELFEPYGEGNEKLKFLFRNAKILDLNLIGRNDKSHVRLLFDAGKHKWPAVYWNAADRVGKDFDTGDIVEVVFNLGKNFFQNTEQFQLTVIDIKRV
jgi:single-stranded-DNA-specific exonuclease